MSAPQSQRPSRPGGPVEVAAAEVQGAPAASELHEIVIRPARGWIPLNLRELWEHRELLYLLAWRNVKVRYTQTAFGAAWAVIPPVLTMLVFTVIFGRFAHLQSDGAPYALFSYCALVPWTYFSTSVTLASTSLVENERLITRVYFPRLLVPLSVVLAGLIDLLISFLLLMGLALVFSVYPEPKLLLVAPLVLLTMVATFAIAMTLSALNVFYRDVRYVIPFLMQFWLFVTPVAYSSSMLSERLRAICALNPMTGIVDGFRWAVLDTAPAPTLTLPISTASALVLLVCGVYYFRRFEDVFADVI